MRPALQISRHTCGVSRPQIPTFLLPPPTPSGPDWDQIGTIIPQIISLLLYSY